MLNERAMQLALDIRPIDTLFFRDARPFGPAGQGRSGLPTPQTLAGAIRTMLLERHDVDWSRVANGTRQYGSLQRALEELGPDFAAIGKVTICGPWIKRDNEVLVPAPANLRQKTGGEMSDGVVRLDPLRKPPPGWAPAAGGMLPLWRYGRERLKPLGPTTYLRPQGLAVFLEGDVPKACALVDRDKLYTMDVRVGIGLDSATGTAATGLIYSTSLLELKPGVTFYAELSGPESALAPLLDDQVLMRFGGEGKYVSVQSSTTLARWPPIPREAGQGKILLLTTPAALDGWRPNGLDLVSAAVGKPQAVSGWNMARGGPKPNRFMVPAGSVYFLCTGAQVPPYLGLAEDSQIGWGHFLEGNWNYV